MQSRAAVRTYASAQVDKTAMIKSTVSSNKVVVFSKTYCPYCTRVKDLLKSLRVEAKVLELDSMGAEGDAIQNSLQTITGRRTVPQVFIGQSFIGGCDDTLALHGAGGLVPALKEAGVSVA